jgi:metal-responsive CopG/Arc/MetJ family transcriptional regulator
MAKVLVSFPDDLLREIDLRAEELGESRSAYLRGLVEADIEEDERRGREEAKRLMDSIRAEFRDDEPPIDAAKMIREDRESH